MRLRNWAWFGIIQKTRPLIGMINIEEEIKLLENAAEYAIKESEKEASGLCILLTELWTVPHATIFKIGYKTLRVVHTRA